MLYSGALWRHGDRTITSTVQLLNSLSANVNIFFQWVLSHMNVSGNEIADALAREGSHNDRVSEYLRRTVQLHEGF
ncbi:hypothetical protein TNCV_223901 [Trichonephila clavipes]|nr:hypothetical protein TNCV_223901 [Trichonephila clavipes]